MERPPSALFNATVDAWNLLMMLWLWLPVVFGAYAIGRRKVSLAFFAVLLTAESIALAIRFSGIQFPIVSW